MTIQEVQLLDRVLSRIKKIAEEANKLETHCHELENIVKFILLKDEEDCTLTKEIENLPEF